MLGVESMLVVKMMEALPHRYPAPTIYGSLLGYLYLYRHPVWQACSKQSRLSPELISVRDNFSFLTSVKFQKK